MEKERLAGIGAATAAGIGSACCIVPAILSGLGFGAVALDFVKELGIFRLPMTILAVSFFLAAFYFKFHKRTRRSASAECHDAACGKVSEISAFFWVTAFLTIVLLSIPYVL